MSTTDPAQPSGAADATPSSTTIHIGTRKSALALKQTQLVVDALSARHPHLTFSIHGMTTTGDRDLNTALYNFGGKGLWTTELEALLVGGQVDFVVHSLKDMPTTLPEGCVLGAVSPREDPRDVVVFKRSLVAPNQPGAEWKTLGDLPAGSVVGTSSVRRIAQLKRRYPGLAFADMRGNIETRLRKLDDETGPFTANILAAAGLLRLNYGDRIAQYLDSDSAGILHAVGQGAIGIECREGDERILSIVKAVEDRQTMLACVAERSLMRTLEGGCSVPIGVETSWTNGGKLRMQATVVDDKTAEGVDADQEGDVTSAEEADAFGRRVADQLVSVGADKILDAITSRRLLAAAADVVVANATDVVAAS